MIDCDIRACVGCRACEVACSLEHFGAVSPALARIRVAKIENTGIDLAIACAGCVERHCLNCPGEALSVGSRGEILLDSALCNGCGICVEACPIGAVGWFRDHPLVCDLCCGRTVCIGACPSKALSLREEEDTSFPEPGTPAENAAERRAKYAQLKGRPLRESWKDGMRVDS
jgi:anaerobic carbon-monoxide dehydrogenase iron sulfur subunit